MIMMNDVERQPVISFHFPLSPRGVDFPLVADDQLQRAQIDNNFIKTLATRTNYAMRLIIFLYSALWRETSYYVFDH